MAQLTRPAALYLAAAGAAVLTLLLPAGGATVARAATPLAAGTATPAVTASPSTAPSPPPLPTAIAIASPVPSPTPIGTPVPSSNCDPAGECTASWNPSVPGAPVTWTVPDGVTSITLTLDGGSGGSDPGGASGGAGAQVVGTLAVSPGEQLTITVGASGQWSATSSQSTGGYPNGGAGGSAAGGGGGATFVTDSSGDLLLRAAGAAVVAATSEVGEGRPERAASVPPVVTRSGPGVGEVAARATSAPPRPR
jgi:hypothetical protein